MAHPANLSLLLARRQKRLLYWRNRFQTELPSQEQSERIRELFATYQQLLTKMAMEAHDSDAAETELRLESIERELTSLFEARRLMTSAIGVPVTPEPTAGEQGH
ncbi:MAG: hypothetical protein KDD69_11020 [Bdellovibrionales bacterium]|nr:hypothetical protein [Bdellovibrionales bacterium]